MKARVREPASTRVLRDGEPEEYQDGAVEAKNVLVIEMAHAFTERG
jgi:hypothetical protein